MKQVGGNKAKKVKKSFKFFLEKEIAKQKAKKHKKQEVI